MQQRHPAAPARKMHSRRRLTCGLSCSNAQSPRKACSFSTSSRMPRSAVHLQARRTQHGNAHTPCSGTCAVLPASYQGPRKAPTCGASASVHIHANRPSVIAAFSTRLRGSAPAGCCSRTTSLSSSCMATGRSSSLLHFSASSPVQVPQGVVRMLGSLTSRHTRVATPTAAHLPTTRRCCKQTWCAS